MAAPQPGNGGTLLHQISSRLPYLAPALRTVGEFILRQPLEAQNMTITQLAAESGVAESTVSRFVRGVGLQDYKELRLAVA
jgi:RpiR family carbohydrate utilization transcriptional regulator